MPPAARAYPLITGLAALLLFTALASTAPIVSKPGRLPDDVRSLSRLVGVATEVSLEQSAPELVALGLTTNAVIQGLTTSLRHGGIDVGNHVEETTVRVRICEAEDVETPDSIAFSVTISLWQNVQVDRLEQSLHVPTYHYTLVGLFSRNDATDMAIIGVKKAVHTFLRTLEEADKQRF